MQHYQVEKKDIFLVVITFSFSGIQSFMLLGYREKNNIFFQLKRWEISVALFRLTYFLMNSIIENQCDAFGKYCLFWESIFTDIAVSLFVSSCWKKGVYNTCFICGIVRDLFVLKYWLNLFQGVLRSLKMPIMTVI